MLMLLRSGVQFLSREVSTFDLDCRFLWSWLQIVSSIIFISRSFKGLVYVYVIRYYCLYEVSLSSVLTHYANAAIHRVVFHEIANPIHRHRQFIKRERERGFPDDLGSLQKFLDYKHSSSTVEMQQKQRRTKNYFYRSL